MAEIVWENNGQGKFDFDYLLELTSEDFVAIVNAVMEGVKRVEVEVDVVSTVVTVTLFSDSVVQVIKYNKKFEAFGGSCAFGESELRRMLRLIGSGSND